MSGFVLVEETSLDGVLRIVAVFALKKTEGDQGIEEVASMSGDAGRGGRSRASRSSGPRASSVKDFHLDGAEKSLRSPEGEAGLQDVIG